MPMNDESLADLDKMLKKARQKPIAYGLCLGKKPEENVMYLDLKKSSEVMMRKAKADGDTGKVTHGIASVAGKVVTLSVEGKMLPALARNMKMFLSKQGMKMKVVITDPDGQVLESDGDEDEDGNDIDVEMAANDDPGQDQDTATPDNTDDVGNDDPLMGQWVQVNTAMTPHVDRFAASGHKKSAAIAAAWQGAQQAAENADYKNALAVANKIKPVVMAVPNDNQQEQENPDKAAWEATHGPTSDLFTQAMSKNPENRSQLEAAWGMAVEKAELGDYAAALKIVDRLKPRLQEAADAAQTGQDQSIPKDVVPFQKSRVLWAGVRTKMGTEIDKLIGVIEKECAGDDELAEVANSASDLKLYLEPFDADLEDILDKITTTVEGPDRTRLKSDAVAKIKDYQDALAGPFFGDVDKDNGFTNVSVAAPAIATLEKIRQICAT